MPGGNGDSVTCVTMLMCEGEWIESDVLVLKADKVTAQGAGSAITYARRYQLAAMLGLAGEEDDDGNHATGNTKPQQTKPSKQIEPNVPKAEKKQEISMEQIQRLYAIASSKGYDSNTVKGHIHKKYGLDSSKELTKAQYEELVKGYESLQTKEVTHE